MILYILPLLMLIAGSFSISNEFENGQWRLLCTYPLAARSYITGKMGGQFTAQAIVFTFSFGISIIVGLLSGVPLGGRWVIAIYAFSLAVLFFFLLLGVAMGAFVKTRWQALIVSVVVWFFLIMMWPILLIGVLNFVPYPMIQPLLQAALFLNPAELVRVIFVVALDGGAVFGQSYDGLVTFFRFGSAWPLLSLYVIGYALVCIFLSSWKMERRKMQ